MGYGARERWLVFEIQAPARADGPIEVSARDQRGRGAWMALDPSGEDRSEALSARRPRGVRTGRSAVVDLLAENEDFARDRLFPHSRTLPVYVRDLRAAGRTPAVDPSTADLERRVRRLLGLEGDSELLWQAVALSRPRSDRWPRRAPLRLPLTIAAWGPEAARVFAPLATHGWFAEVESMDGIRLLAEPTVPAGAGPPADLVIADHRPGLGGRWSDLALSQRPRAVLSLEVARDAPPPVEGPPPPGMSSVHLTFPAWDAAIDGAHEFIYGLLHDLPLHDAAAAAANGADRTFVYTDPEANHGLRLIDVLDRRIDQALELGAGPSAGDVGPFLATASAPVPARVATTLRKLRSESAEVGRVASEAPEFAQRTSAFLQESEGFLPLAEIGFAVARGRSLARRQHRALHALAVDATARAFFEEEQQRRVDVAIQRLTQDLVYPEFADPATTQVLFVDPDTALAAGRWYKLRVRVGRPLPTSLLAEVPPPIDPLLPETEEERGHELDVVLYEQDFSIQGNRVRRLHLPPLGATPLATFPLGAPWVCGTARARIELFHGNHLLQAFVLTAEIRPREEQTPGRAVDTTLVFSRTARFRNLDRLGPRALAISTNRNGDTHTFMIKRGSHAKGLSFTEQTFERQITAFRRTLEDAVADERRRARFPLEVPDADPARFDDVVRTLAYQGKELHRALFKNFKSLEEELRLLRDGDGEILQITRHLPNYVFPWPVIYDRPLPKRVGGAAPPPVCRGRRGDGTPCRHGGGDEVVCVNGFWGVRHQVEQFMSFGADGDGFDAQTTLPRRHEGVVHLALGDSSRYARELVERLKRQIGSPGVPDPAPSVKLLDRIWSGARPSVAVIIGHLETRDVPGEPTGHRIVLAPGEEWLQDSDVLDIAEARGRLDQPQPLVLLLACGSAAIGVETLNDVFSAFLSCGAVAAVGTECTAFPDMVARFAEVVTVGLWRGETLGSAVRDFRRELFANGNPMGFSFVAFGDAGLSFESPGGGG